MSASRLEHAIEAYASKLATLEEAPEKLLPQQALDVLLARDEVRAALAEDPQRSLSGLTKLVQLDSRLRRQGESIARAASVAHWRASLDPPMAAWWWFFFETASPPNRLDRLDWLWSVLAVIFLTASLSLMIDISWRFLSDGPDALGAFAVIAQGLLSMLAAGGALTGAGREGLDRILRAVKVPQPFRQVATMGLAVALLLVLLSFRFSLPRIAVAYNNRGVENYLAGRLDSARLDYGRALDLNPDYFAAHYNLGLLYEDLQDLKAARAEYRVAVQGGLDAAYNNLARLHILSEEYSPAVSLLLTGLERVQDDQVKYDMLKNLGWARLGQGRHSEAELHLRAAVELAADDAPAHCLLAQALEGQDDAARALVEWEDCLRFADPRKPDEDAWIGLARQAMESEEQGP